MKLSTLLACATAFAGAEARVRGAAEPAAEPAAVGAAAPAAVGDFWSYVWPQPFSTWEATTYTNWQLNINVTAAWPLGLPEALLTPLQNAKTTVTVANLAQNAGLDWQVYYSFASDQPIAAGTLEPDSTNAVVSVGYLGPAFVSSLTQPIQLVVNTKNRYVLGPTTSQVNVTQSCPDGTPIGGDFCTNGKVNTYTIPQAAGGVNTYFVTGGCAPNPSYCTAGTPICCANGGTPIAGLLKNCQAQTAGSFCYDCSLACSKQE